MSTRGFGGLARDLRIAKGHSLKEVAEGLQKSIVYISDIERRNRRAPSPEMARQWAAIIGGDADEFEKAAMLDRPAVELSVDQKDPGTAKNRFALELARRWDEITPNEADALDRELNRILKGLEG